MWKRPLRIERFPALSAALLVAILLAGCGASASLPLPASSSASTVAPSVATAEKPAPEAVATEEITTEVASSEAIVVPPVALRIPEIAMDISISVMNWHVVETDGVRTTAWMLPDTGAGWHPNSASPGSVGNVVISGNQLLGDAAFAPIALGDVVVGQEILLTDANGDTFTYAVTEVTDPLPIPDTFAEEQALAAQYVAPTATPSLTLISGWPDFSTTHRVIVRAELVQSDQ